MYAMKKATVYLPDELKAGLERLAREAGKSEAELIREAVGRLVRKSSTPKPRPPLFDSGDATLAERVDEEPARGSSER